MKKLSIMAFASFLVLWGFYTYLMRENPESEKDYPQMTALKKKKSLPQEENGTLLSVKKIRDLDKIGNVINEKNVEIDFETKNKIKVAKKTYDNKQILKEKQNLLEQSYMDRNSSISDIKRLQNSIVELKNKMNLEISNTEKWDPKFVYYLMLQEKYTFSEIDAIKSLSENGINQDEMNYIRELIKEDNFMERITSFKNHEDAGRDIASFKKKIKEKDDFIEGPTEEEASTESKLIEMNYNQEEREEIVYGSNQ
jgi:hypothetical protein